MQHRSSAHGECGEKAHDPDVGRTELRLRHRPRLRRAYRRRQRDRSHVDLRPRQPRRSRRRPGRPHRRAPPARHDGRVVTGMAAVTIDVSRAADPGLTRPGHPVLAVPGPGRSWSWPLGRGQGVVGWVSIAQKTGFSLVSSLPGIWPALHLDTAITLPVGVTDTAYAPRAWRLVIARSAPGRAGSLSGRRSARSRWGWPGRSPITCWPRPERRLCEVVTGT
jgi:hypothetical protein